MKQREKSDVFANRISTRKKRPGIGHLLKKSAVFLLPITSYMKGILANQPPFWTKTDLRIEALFVYTIQQSQPKTTRSEPRETVRFVASIRNTHPIFSALAGCRGIAPIEGTEIDFLQVQRR